MILILEIDANESSPLVKKSGELELYEINTIELMYQMFQMLKIGPVDRQPTYFSISCSMRMVSLILHKIVFSSLSRRLQMVTIGIVAE